LNAEGQTERSHAWITAFAPADAPRIAVSVMLKGVDDDISAGTGGRLAGPIAKKILDQALKVVPPNNTANSTNPAR
jgi:peptidoglycan glycosyltransferase